MVDNGDWLEEKSQVKEQPFVSHTPVIGPLLVRFRSAWNSVAAKWYVRAIMQQQNEVNALLVSRLHDIDERLIAQDRDTTLLRHDLAEVTVQLIQTNRRLADLAERLAQIERRMARSGVGDEEAEDVKVD